MTKELLESFCLQEYEIGKASLRVPFNQDGFTIATDARILIRVPVRPEYEGNIGRPCGKFFEGISDITQFVPMPEPVEFGDDYVCDKCGYGHKIPQWEDVKIGERWFHPFIFEKLNQFSNVRIAVDGAAEQPCYITFDGGDGVIMPFRKAYGT